MIDNPLRGKKMRGSKDPVLSERWVCWSGREAGESIEGVCFFQPAISFPYLSQLLLAHFFSILRNLVRHHGAWAPPASTRPSLRPCVPARKQKQTMGGCEIREPPPPRACILLAKERAPFLVHFFSLFLLCTAVCTANSTVSRRDIPSPAASKDAIPTRTG